MSQIDDHYGLLKQIVPFSLLSDARQQRLRTAVRHCRYIRGETILLSAESPACVYVLLKGRAKTCIQDSQGRVMTLSSIDKHELFGSIDLFDDAVAGHSVKAVEPCEALCMPRTIYLESIAGNYEAAVAMLHIAESRLRQAHQKVATLGLLGVYERVARALVDSAEEVDGRWVVATGSEEIARSVAASREMVSRVFRSMKARGLVAKSTRTTVILDWHSMRAACAL